jgi:hypothetical protein
MAQVLVADLPGTLATWEAGTLDVLKVRAITETSYLLTSGSGPRWRDGCYPAPGSRPCRSCAPRWPGRCWQSIQTARKRGTANDARTVG